MAIQAARAVKLQILNLIWTELNWAVSFPSRVSVWRKDTVRDSILFGSRKDIHIDYRLIPALQVISWYGAVQIIFRLDEISRAIS